MTTAEASRFSRVLEKISRSPNGGRAWDLVDPGTLPWILRQGADLGLLGSLLADPELLVHAEPARVLALVDEFGAQDGLNFAVYRHDAARLSGLSPVGRRQLLIMNAARYGHWPLVESLAEGQSTIVPWVPRWYDACERTRSLCRAMSMPGPEIEQIVCDTIGSRLVVAALNADGVVSAWDAFQEEPYGLPWVVRRHQVGSLTLFSWSGRAIAAAGTLNGEVLVHDLLTGEPLTEFAFGELNGARVTSATTEFGPAIAAVAFDGQGTGELRIWDPGSDRVIARYVHSTASLVAITAAETPNGVVFAVGDFSGNVGFVRLGERDIEWQERKHSAAIVRLATGVVGGRPLVVSTDVFGEMIVWDPSTRTVLDLRIPLSRRGSPPVAISSVRGVPSIIVGGFNGLRCADLVEASVEERSTGNSRVITAVTAVRSRDRDLAVVGGGGQVQLFDLGIPDPIPWERRRATISVVASARLPRRSLVVIVDQDSAVWIIDSQTGRIVRGPIDHQADCAAPVDGTPWVALASFRGSDFGPILMNPFTGEQRAVARSKPRAVSCLSATRMGQNLVVASGGRDGTVEVWTSDGDQIFAFSPHDEELTVSRLEFTMWAGSLVLVSGSADGTIAATNVLDGRLLGRRAAHRDAVTALAARGSTVISGSYDGEIRTWQGLQSRDVLEAAHAGAVKAVAIPRTTRPSFVSTGDDAVLRTWALEDATPISSMTVPSPIQAMAATDSGLVAAMGRELLHLRPSDGSP